jgi:pilus assembly protein Flp/PilA
MIRLRHWIIRFLMTEDGPTAVEYAILAASIIALCVLAIAQLGSTTNVVFTNNAGKISAS